MTSNKLQNAVAWLILFVAVFPPRIATAQARFQGLGPLPPPYTQIFAGGFSPDGRIVLESGISPDFSAIEGFYWTEETQAVSSGPYLGDVVTSDGNLIAGGYVDIQALTETPYRWTQTDGIQLLGHVPGGNGSGGGYVYRASENGAVLTGTGDGFAFRWTAENGMENLGGYPGVSGGRSWSSGISADGSTIVGYALADPNSGNLRGVIWRSNAEPIGLGVLPGALSNYSQACAVSGDGTVVVGYCSAGIQYRLEAFKWTAATGMVDIGFGMNSGIDTLPYAISADGDIVAGKGDNGAIIYDPQQGFQDLYSVLLNSGASGLDGWFLSEAVAVSSDGQTILGNGHHYGYPEVWIARIPRTGPCPGDTNSDRVIDLADLAQTLSEYGQVGFGLPGDLNNDGRVDLGDLALILANFGDVCP